MSSVSNAIIGEDKPTVDESADKVNILGETDLVLVSNQNDDSGLEKDSTIGNYGEKETTQEQDGESMVKTDMNEEQNVDNVTMNEEQNVDSITMNEEQNVDSITMNEEQKDKVTKESNDALYSIDEKGEREEDEMSQASLVDLGSDSSSDSSSEEEEDNDQAELESVKSENDDFEVIKSKNETIKPVIEPINITLTNEAIVLLGNILSIVDDTLTINSVQSGEDSIVDLDSLVCTKDKIVVGRLFDIIGQIKKPIYIINFNNNQEIQEKNLKVGDELYYAPKYSNLVKTNGLKTKGSDASNLYDEEIMEDEQEFSDDEQERLKKRGLEDGEISSKKKRPNKPKNEKVKPRDNRNQSYNPPNRSSNPNQGNPYSQPNPYTQPNPYSQPSLPYNPQSQFYQPNQFMPNQFNQQYMYNQMNPQFQFNQAFNQYPAQFNPYQQIQPANPTQDMNEQEKQAYIQNLSNLLQHLQKK
ncbi:hypothetical protein HK103_005562 [Boothiomyces macroporosus]|uniref:H/ACA ribonucleoprotein complex non-core subunit NAF1 n=1 Tax=Boothiomyces macroporosus TaxID=261099 RepID=A0AAD5UHW7_9FUNG|nr:hypothetical protein HK103_005562 [Boothiomyces macroporosus]